WRTLYCKTCKCFRQRDVMASDNMNAAVKGHLIDQQRPLHLQPQRQNGTYPWRDVTGGGCGEVVGGSSTLALATRAADQGTVKTTSRKRLAPGAQGYPNPPSGSSRPDLDLVVGPSRLDKKNRIL
ncbi:hypothetical protein BGZ58_006680, partial [Dissophora ornata]